MSFRLLSPAVLILASGCMFLALASCTRVAAPPPPLPYVFFPSSTFLLYKVLKPPIFIIWTEMEMFSLSLSLSLSLSFISLSFFLCVYVCSCCCSCISIELSQTREILSPNTYFSSAFVNMFCWFLSLFFLVTSLTGQQL